MNPIESILKNKAMAREIAGKVALLLSRPSVAASIASIEEKTGLDFGELKQFDPLAQQESLIRDLQVPEDVRL